MRTEIVIRGLGTLLKIMGILMLIPGGVAAYYHEPSGVISFALTAVVTMVAGSVLEHLGTKDEEEMEEMGTREGFALVAIGWLAAACFGALPYIFLGLGVVDALFESMSSFTTTGASVLTHQNAQGYFILDPVLANQSLAYVLAGTIPYISQALSTPADAGQMSANLTLLARGDSYMSPLLEAASGISVNGTFFGLLFWRCFSQWLGGMGIILLFIAILPKLGVAGRQLFKAEVPGHEKDALTPRIRQTARLLWGVYLGLTLLEVIFLFLGGMPLYDSFCNTFATMATGGFSPRAASIAFYKSPLLETIIIIFMFLAGANFALHYRVVHGDRRALIRDQEFRVYALIVSTATLFIMFWGGLDGGYVDRLRLAAFQVVSMITTTGFATTDFNIWSHLGRLVLLILMFVGACAGSTGGAIKVSRIILTLKMAHRELFTALHPKAVMQVKLGNTVVREEILQASAIFIALYLLIFALACVLLSAVYPVQDIDPSIQGDSCKGSAMDSGLISVISAVATTLGNVGPGLGDVGPMGNFAHLNSAGKVILLLCMWIGRLEVVTVLVLMLPEFWKR